MPKKSEVVEIIHNMLKNPPLTDDGRSIVTATKRMSQDHFDETCKFNVITYVAALIEEDSHLFFSRNLKRQPIIWIADTRMFFGETVSVTASRTVEERFTTKMDPSRFLETKRYVTGVFGSENGIKHPIHKCILITSLLITSLERQALKISGKYDGYKWKLPGEVLSSKSAEYGPMLKQIVAQYVDWINDEGGKPYYQAVELIRKQNERDSRARKTM